MGVHAQSQMKAVLPRALGYRGMALPSAMFALVAASILAAGLFALTDLSSKATLNQQRATTAMQVADAGLSHAVSLLRGDLRMHSFTRILRGSDNFIPTADDSLLINYGLAGADVRGRPPARMDRRTPRLGLDHFAYSSSSVAALDSGS